MTPAFVQLSDRNVHEHHLCCALGDPKHAAGVDAKRRWLKRRFREGLVFLKLDVRGKVFIEYADAERAWRPIVAPGWLTIHCLPHAPLPRPVSIQSGMEPSDAG